ncbi:MAG: PDZ domain-containing protein, partial [Salinisphaeraceae bacterium]|nr:PDZ domain-containing protein [Salinisphaeraceae bacterium]
ARHPSDRGGRYTGASMRNVELGWQTRNDNGRLIVATTTAGGPAQHAGVNVGDELVACNGLRVTGDSYAECFASAKAGDKQTWHVFRDGQLVALNITLDERPVDTWRLRIAEDCDTEVAARRDAWLGTRISAPD